MIEIILLYCITVWFGNVTVSCKAVQRMVRMAEKIIGSLLPIQDVARNHCLTRVRSIVWDSTHPLHDWYCYLLGRVFVVSQEE